MTAYNVQMQELPSPYGDCEESEDYVQSQCLAECQANYVIGNCNCKETYMPGEKDNARNISLETDPVDFGTVLENAVIIML